MTGKRSTLPELSAVEARRIAIAAQGFAPPGAATGVNASHIRRLAARLGAFQVDAVNVLIRSQYLPAFSRLGPYDPKALDRLTHRRRALFEYLGHAASLLPIELHPLLRWRMRRHADREWASIRSRVERRRPGYVAALLREIEERGPLAYSDLSDPGKRERVATGYADATIAWWHWSDGKDVLEGLFMSGQLAVAGRRGAERLYDLAQRVIPADVWTAPTPPEEEARRSLVHLAARAMGVATVSDLADYFRFGSANTRARVRELVEDGRVRQVRVEGWREPAYLDLGAKPASDPVRSLLSPFDSLVWNRKRTERLFGFHYRIEIYVPEPKRRHGYYVLPFLAGDAIVARADLKADRQRGTLVVPAVFLEPGHDARRTAADLAEALRAMASWLELDKVEVGNRGDLAAHLQKAIKRRV